jgi:hypothetical protein
MYQYKLVAVQRNSGVGTLEELLNNHAQEDYEPIKFFDVDARIMCLLRRKVEVAGQRGRPKKVVEDSPLGS